MQVQEQPRTKTLGTLITQCCMCKRLSVDRVKWAYYLPEVNAPDARVSHGYCADCFCTAHTELEELLVQKRRAMLATTARRQCA